MIEQYKKETSQIHAPAELIQKTRLAMQQEEQRLREAADKAGRPDMAVGAQVENTAKAAKNSIKVPRRIYRWTLPLSAAAALLILVSVSRVLRSSQSDYSASDMAADSGYVDEADMQFEDAAAAEEVMEESETIIDENPVKPDRKAAKADYAIEEPAETASAEAETAESAADSGYEVSNSAADIEITRVDEELDFYDSPDTEEYLYENLIFWAAQDENGEWFAYVSVRGDQYVIVSSIADQEEFLAKAYGLVEETVKSME